jgi:predicted nucleotidyltransferase
MPVSFIEGFVFGSVARNEAKAHSDVDIMLLIHDPKQIENSDWDEEKILIKVIEIDQEYGIELSYYTHYIEYGEDYFIQFSESSCLPFISIVQNSILEKNL